MRVIKKGCLQEGFNLPQQDLVSRKQSTNSCNKYMLQFETESEKQLQNIRNPRIRWFFYKNLNRFLLLIFYIIWKQQLANSPFIIVWVLFKRLLEVTKNQAERLFQLP